MKNTGVMVLGMILLLGVLRPSGRAQSSNKWETDPRSYHEISGTIEQVSPTVRLIRIASADKPDVTICIEPETKIKVKGKEGTLKDLEEGQFVEVVLLRGTSKAISVDAT